MLEKRVLKLTLLRYAFGHFFKNFKFQTVLKETIWFLYLSKKKHGFQHTHKHTHPERKKAKKHWSDLKEPQLIGICQLRKDLFQIFFCLCFHLTRLHLKFSTTLRFFAVVPVKFLGSVK